MSSEQSLKLIEGLSEYVNKISVEADLAWPAVIQYSLDDDGDPN